MSARALLAAAACGVLIFSLAACGEIDQTAKTEKVYAGKKDERAYDNKLFGNDKKKWEASLAQRSNTQNEYLRTDSK
jgi:hypothetical protein